MQNLVTLIPVDIHAVALKVFINRDIPESVKQMLLNEGFVLTVWVGKNPIPSEELNTVLVNHEAILSTGSISIHAEFLQRNSHIKIISQASAGYNNIDLETATQLGILVANAPDTMTKATADISFMLMLACSRKLVFMNRKILKGEWNHFGYLEYLGQELHGKTLGVFGLGIIGFQMAYLCKMAYGMTILYHNRTKNERAERELNAHYVSFDELLTQSDVISVHCNLTEETKGIFNQEAFHKMKRTAIFINVARGGVHHEADLIEALEKGEIWGAGLDVTNPEPMQQDNPLLTMENAVVTPHIGSATINARTAMAASAANSIIQFFKGEKVTNRLHFP